jgi:hypothetical protein
MKRAKLLAIIILVLLIFNGLTAQATHKVKDKQLDEISGITASRVNAGLYYVHNDSGGKSEVYVLDGKGKTRHTLILPYFVNRDWEDIAVGPGPEPEVSYVYVGEIGDNKAQYSNVVLYRFREPDLSKVIKKKPTSSEIADISAVSIMFEDGARDCETLMLDPMSGDVYLVSKREQKVGLYQIKAPLADAGINVARRILDLDFALAVGGDISPQRDKVIIKTYEKVYCWSLEPGQEIKDALSQPPTELPYVIEPQGEAICWSAQGDSYLTLSEKAKKTPLYFYRYSYPPEKQN